MLNAKETQFVELVLQGETYTNAYKIAYNSNAKAKAINKMAYKLFHKDKIQDYYRKKLEQIHSENIYPIEQQLKDLLYEMNMLRSDITDYRQLETWRRLLATYNDITNGLSNNNAMEDNLRALIDKVDISVGSVSLSKQIEHMYGGLGNDSISND